MKKIIFVLLCISGVTAYGRQHIVVIDPGHGGNDAGSLGYLNGKMIKEKDIALSISKRVQKILFEEFAIYLTRTSDRYLSLKKRAEIAEKVKADLFISIHANSTSNKNFHGFETYYLDNKKDKALTKLEKSENQDHNWSDTNKIIMDIIIKKTVDRSKDFATIIHGKIKKALKPFNFRDRGVKTGLFYVLAFSKRPGVLLEIGFLSNKNELKKILDTKVQDQYAIAIAQGIREYFTPK